MANWHELGTVKVQCLKKMIFSCFFVAQIENMVSNINILSGYDWKGILFGLGLFFYKELFPFISRCLTLTQ